MKRAGVVLLASSVLGGCVTTYEDIHSDFHTVQNGPMCYTVAQDERKFNSPTMVPPRWNAHAASWSV